MLMKLTLVHFLQFSSMKLRKRCFLVNYSFPA